MFVYIGLTRCFGDRCFADALPCSFHIFGFISGFPHEVCLRVCARGSKVAETAATVALSPMQCAAEGWSEVMLPEHEALLPSIYWTPWAVSFCITLETMQVCYMPGQGGRYQMQCPFPEVGDHYGT